MNTDALNTIVGVLVPLITIIVGAAVTAFWQWSSTTTTATKKGTLADAVLTAVKATMHTTLAQGQLFNYAQHGAAVTALVNQLAPGWPAALVAPLVQAAMNTANTTILQVEAQRTTAAASVPTVIQPSATEFVDALLQAAIARQTTPPAPPPAVTPAPTSTLIVPPGMAPVPVEAGTS